MIDENTPKSLWIHHIFTDSKNTECNEFSLEWPTYPSDVTQFEDLDQSLIKKFKIPKNRPVRIYCDGIYDLFHYGHARSLLQAKNLFNNVILIVGLPHDEVTKRLKGTVVLSQSERVESLKHCKYVDEVVENAPWTISDEFLKTFNIDLVAHDAVPYVSNNSADVYGHLKERGIFIPTKRTLNVSTTGIITKIVQDYDVYVRRNLKRGISEKEMNFTFLKKLDCEIHLINTNMKNQLKKMRGEIKIAMNYWERMSSEIVKKFAEKFNKLKRKIKDKV